MEMSDDWRDTKIWQDSPPVKAEGAEEKEKPTQDDKEPWMSDANIKTHTRGSIHSTDAPDSGIVIRD